MKLEYLMSYHVDLKPPTIFPRGPLGTRMVYDLVDGAAEGPKIKGRFQKSGGDWLLADDSGICRLDVRGTLETDDGALIYMQYYGILVMTERVSAVAETGKGIAYGDTYFMIQPRFETGDERYEWLNRIVAVGEGRVLPNAVEYNIYQVLND
ncbi:MAG: DUF3237 domain-containing protein [Thermodesulfobacteriota bacterium]